MVSVGGEVSRLQEEVNRIQEESEGEGEQEGDGGQEDEGGQEGEGGQEDTSVVLRNTNTDDLLGWCWNGYK